MIDGFPLTEEQEEIVDAARQGSVCVQALAGTGKTTTLRAIVNDMPENLRVHYLIFNSRMRLSAEKTFDKGRVYIKTFHGLAMAATRKQFHGRTLGNIRLRDIRAICGDIKPAGEELTQTETLAAIAATLRNFLNSAEPKPDWFHVPRIFCTRLTTDITEKVKKEGPDHLRGPNNTLSAKGERHVQEEVGLALRYIANHADSAFHDYVAPHHPASLPLPHDVYLKTWQLAGATMETDLLLVDEAQDLNPVMLDIVRQHQGRTIAVGDSRQQIYSWRGSIDALDSLEGVVLPLTTSFRFGPQIAERANEVLRLLDSPYLLVGRGPDAVEFLPSERHAQLYRTNSAMLAGVIAESAKGRKVHCTRAIGPLVSLLDDLCRAYDNQWQSARDPRVQHAGSWALLKEELADDIDAAPLLRLVEQNVGEARQMVESLSGFTSRPAVSADVILTTAHQSKGLEFTNVEICPDFAGRAQRDVEELRLLYVALTRAKRGLFIPPLVTADIYKLLREQRV